MRFNRHDVCEAWYLFLSHYHEGQDSRKYARLSKLLGYYTPSAGGEFGATNENSEAIYHELCLKEGVWK